MTLARLLILRKIPCELPAMGFYLELKPVAGGGAYHEEGIPGYFWALFGFAGFALACMGGAAYALLWDLARSGSAWDQLLVGVIFAFLPFYLVIGFKLAFMRRFVDYRGEELRIGFQVGKSRWFEKRVNRKDIQEILFINQRPAGNVAPVQHKDKQYYIQGHWRLIALRRNGKKILIDRHTEKAMLEPLHKAILVWVSG